MPKRTGSIERRCTNCGTTFHAWPYVIRAGGGLACSRRCHNDQLGAKLSAYHQSRRQQLEQPSEYRLIATSGSPVKVDIEDFDYLTQWVWSENADGYCWINNLRNGKLLLHRLVMERELDRKLAATELVDHVNRDSRDNRRHNLRLATQSQNRMNVGITSRNTSGFKGVAFDKNGARWRAYIGGGGLDKQLKLGTFQTAEEAAYIYDQFALALHGEFAVTNFLH